MFLLLALFEPFLYFIGETTGLSYVDPSMASVIISVIPLFTPFVAYYFLNERITVLNVLGIVISITGIVVLVLGKDMSLQVSLIGLGLLFLAIIAANGYSVMIKKIPDEYSIFNIIIWQNIIGMIYFAPLLAIFSRNDIMVTGFVEEAFWAIFNLGFFASTLAFLFYMYGLKFMSVTKVNVFTNVIPIFTIIVSYFFLGEEIGPKKILGILIVIIGVVISQLKYRIFSQK
jgi:drug/metabolite transporter (DMT)-like permease